MSEFHDAVSTLLEAFARGLSIIKAQKKRRSKEQTSTKTVPEVQLSKSLKRNRKDVKAAYSRDLAQFGPGFAAGDVESRSSLSTILSRLSTGLLSIIERFTRGRCTMADYQALLNLSNTTRNETIHTFDQLSKRLSSSSLALAPTRKSPERRNRSHTTKKSTAHHTRAKSAPDLSITPLGPANTSGWVRPKPGRRRAFKSKSLGSLDTKRKATPPPPPKAIPPAPSPQSTPEARLTPRPTRENRKSFMSFASDSTKLGEIPEHKWTRPPVVYEAGDVKFPVTTYYPLEPYEEPVKPRSRFMRLFKR